MAAVHVAGIILYFTTNVRYGEFVNWDNEPPLYRTLFAFLGAIIGGFVVWMIGGRELHVVPLGVSYGDLAAIALTAVTVLLAVFALACAFAALYGYREFMKRSASIAAAVAEKKTAEAVEAVVESYLDRNLDRDLTKRAQTIATRVITPEYLQQLIIEQIDALALGNVRDESLDTAAALEAAATEPDDLDELDKAAAEDEGDGNGDPDINGGATQQ